MPIYEYQCDSCGGRFEAVQKFSDPMLSSCILCSEKTIRKVLSTPAFVLKGSGWDVTDYPTNDRKQAESAEKPAEAPKPAAACAAGSCPGTCATKS